MGTAYTPGLKVSADAVVDKMRRLPVKGTVPVKVGDQVEPDTIVARAELPGDLETVRLADRMSVDPDELQGKIRVAKGDNVEKGQVLAEVKGFFGFFNTQGTAPCAGKVEFYSDVTGHLGIRKPPIPIEIDAYVSGVVQEVFEGEGVLVRARGAMIQGIFGVGGERQGEILMVCTAPDQILDASKIPERCEGKVLIGGSLVRADALKRAAERKAVAIVAGGMLDQDLREYLGYDLGVAITGDEDVPLTLVLTEGFGEINMAKRTFELLKSLEGRKVSVNGATQIRAGALRPEIIVPHAEKESAAAPVSRAEAGQLVPGTPIRAIRTPYFGELGEVTELPPEPVRIPTGAVVRVLRMKLQNGQIVEVPRANVEIIER
jgi:hypothetical protein